MAFCKESGIMAQSAANCAAQILAARITAGHFGADTKFYEEFDKMRQAIFRDTLRMAERDTPLVPPQQRGGFKKGTSALKPGDVVLKGGKWAGKTIAQVDSEDKSYGDWMLREGQNEFLKTKWREYRTSTIQANLDSDN